VRDQRVRVLSDPEEGLQVVPVTEEQKAAAAQQGQSKALQFMLSFDMEDWEAMKQLVPADSCIMPHRGHEDGATPAAGAGAGAGAGGSRSRPAPASEQQQQHIKKARRS
jgi:hypothetical protein